MNQRRRLPNCRRHERIAFAVGGCNHTVGIGRFDDGIVGEMFLDASAKSGTAFEAAARDAAVTASIALQHRKPVESIRYALIRDRRGHAAGPLGAIPDILAAEDAHA
jgi:hypothetical protein